MIKNRIIISCFLTFICSVQLSFSQDNKPTNTPNSIYTVNLRSDKSGYDFNAFMFSQKLKKQLENYNIRLYKIDEIRNGNTHFTLKYMGKSFFEDYYIMYKDDLTKYFPKPLDFSTYNYKKTY